jgi:hypothetical protein
MASAGKSDGLLMAGLYIAILFIMVGLTLAGLVPPNGMTKSTELWVCALHLVSRLALGMPILCVDLPEDDGRPKDWSVSIPVMLTACASLSR